jgi:hypothetical protein
VAVVAGVAGPALPEIAPVIVLVTVKSSKVPKPVIPVYAPDNLALSNVPLVTWLAAIAMLALAAKVNWPWAFTVNVATCVAEPYEAAVTAVLARLTVPLVVIGPPVRPVPVATLVTVPVPAPPVVVRDVRPMNAVRLTRKISTGEFWLTVAAAFVAPPWIVQPSGG